jgi:PAS domain S-box-containing protein
VTQPDRSPSEGPEDLFEDAPCGLLTTAPDGTIRRVNRTFERWTGLDRADLSGGRRFVDLLSPAGRIYHETHFAPLLKMQGTVGEIAFQIIRADGSRLPALVNAVAVGEAGAPRAIRIAVFEAADRRGYEEELLRARRDEHELALRLQRSLLVGSLPSGPGLEIAATYRPAGSGLEVGGDWYDAYRLDERRVALVVGDVVGRGIEAATVMGQLRSAVRALSVACGGPAEVLERLDDYAGRHDIGTMATVVYAELAPESGELSFACAGHLPPVLVGGDREPRLLWEGRSPALAFRRRDARPRPEASHKLVGDSTVLLYTDGLVERRNRSIDASERAMLDAIRSRVGEPVADLTANLVRDLTGDGGDDDVCLLAAAMTGRS